MRLSIDFSLEYTGKTAPVKISPVNAWVRPARPAKREKGRRGERTPCDGKISVARGKERERGEHGREEEFSLLRKPFLWRGDPRRER